VPPPGRPLSKVRLAKSRSIRLFDEQERAIAELRVELQQELGEEIGFQAALRMLVDRGRSRALSDAERRAEREGYLRGLGAFRQARANLGDAMAGLGAGGLGSLPAAAAGGKR
jgi:hypothetical protein